MRFYCYNPQGFDGGLVRVEVDIRRGLPAIDIVGLAGAAVRESRERVRVALRNAGIEFPLGHVVINLSPAGLPKVGAVFDLAIALAIARAWSKPDGEPEENEPALLVMGELTLSGDICAVDAVVPALMVAREAGIGQALVPRQNTAEARMVGGEGVMVAATLTEAMLALTAPGRTVLAVAAQAEEQGREIQIAGSLPRPTLKPAAQRQERFDTEAFLHYPQLLTGLMAAAAGQHHIVLYGPPGAGKTMALRFLGTLLPALDPAEALEVNRLYSLAGLLSDPQSLITEAPVRMPHHGSSAEALLGGGKRGIPGEMSLAHHGLLVLDEAPEFRTPVLQALREPMEDGIIRLGRANGALWFPAHFMLGLSLNPCPCGRMGSGRGVCSCSLQEIQRYWGRIGAPVFDRVDIRLPMGMGRVETPLDSWLAACPITVDWRDPQDIRQAVLRARARARGEQGTLMPNGRLQGLLVDKACLMEPEAKNLLDGKVGELGWLARSRHGVMRLAKTIADLGGYDRINEQAMAVAISLRTPIEALPGLTLAG